MSTLQDMFEGLERIPAETLGIGSNPNSTSFIRMIRDIRGNGQDITASSEDETCIYGDIVAKYGEIKKSTSFALF